MVYYEWNSAVILDEVERKEVDLEMEPAEPLSVGVAAEGVLAAPSVASPQLAS